MTEIPELLVYCYEQLFKPFKELLSPPVKSSAVAALQMAAGFFCQFLTL